MPHELPVNWNEIEKACLAGVPQRQVAKDIAAKTPGLDPQKLYQSIRKRASRERWPLPDAIMRRARAQAKVAAGVAPDAKAASAWSKGESGRTIHRQSREILGDTRTEGELLAPLAQQDAQANAEPLGCVARVVAADASPNAREGQEMGFAGLGGGGGALQREGVSAESLVTSSLAERGQTGLSLALDATLAALRSLDPAQPVPIRSMTDLLTAVKATQAAAGLDKPAAVVAISLNSGSNTTIAGWESA